jgi:site-specific recombinase XerD
VVFLVKVSDEAVLDAKDAQAIMGKLASFAGSARDRFIVFAVFQSGVLVSDLVALNVGDYPVEAWMGFETVSGRVGRCRFGVSTPEACACLAAYLEERKGQIGEPLLVGKNGAFGVKDVNRVLKEVIHRSGLDKIRGFTAKCMCRGFEATLKSPGVYLQVKEILLK